MSDAALRKIWTLLASTCLLFCAYAYMRSVGVEKVDDPTGGLLGYLPPAAPLFATLVQSFLIVLLLLVTVRWMREHPHPRADRFPVFHFDRTDVDPATLDGRAFQGMSFVMFLLLPLLANLRTTYLFLSGKVFHQAHAIVHHWSDHFYVCGLRARHAIAPDDLLWYGYYIVDAGGKVTKGPEYLCATPWIVVSLAGLSTVLWLWVSWMIVRKRQPPARSTPGPDPYGSPVRAGTVSPSTPPASTAER